ncbi:[SSU ribosomal protein S18P]-alanine acetyltransferase [Anaerolinea thermolimosa]|uniref:GNAT family N-acetyltransferase n=1 Tax=Anaerolinea thermolimosa TaxID=229919 RepID=UPI0007845CBC|nr:GNAT family N-acetyltransferase [Anaerolinea thermolimosa]GAP08186.1 [SSU ribosomal protein S18P]-alanine acetyltransferase [Anaerolinea thermolimosa]
MQSGFILTGAGLGDLNALRRLEQECFGGDAWPLWDLIGVLILPGLVRLKAVIGSEMIGFVGGDPHPAEGVGWVATLGVLPAYRRRGVASALLQACEKAMGMPTIRLSVRRSNLAALQLYHNHGYHLVDVWNAYYFDGEDALVLEKKMQFPPKSG